MKEVNKAQDLAGQLETIIHCMTFLIDSDSQEGRDRLGWLLYTAEDMSKALVDQLGKVPGTG